MTNTERVREQLSRGPATQHQLAEALRLLPTQVNYAVQGMQSRAEITSLGRVPGSRGNGREMLYALTENLQVVTRQTLVATALANEPDLARVWK